MLSQLSLFTALSVISLQTNSACLVRIYLGRLWHLNFSLFPKSLLAHSSAAAAQFFNTVSIAGHHWRNSRHKQSARCFLFHNFNVNCIFSRQTVSVIFKSCPFSQCQCQCQHPRAMFAADLNFSQSQCRPLGINVLTLALLVNTVDQLFPTHKYKMSLIHEMAVKLLRSVYMYKLTLSLWIK